MDEDVEMENIRSHADDRFAFLTFIVKCNRNVNVFWRDYSGRRVKYATLRPGSHFDMDTFETHPWEFRDAESGDILVARDGNRPSGAIYMPQAWTGGDVTQVFIDIPVYSLKARCLQIVRSMFDEKIIRRLHIPETLIQDILDNPPIQYDIRMHFQPVIH